MSFTTLHCIKPYSHNNFVELHVLAHSTFSLTANTGVSGATGSTLHRIYFCQCVRHCIIRKRGSLQASKPSFSIMVGDYELNCKATKVIPFDLLNFSLFRLFIYLVYFLINVETACNKSKSKCKACKTLFLHSLTQSFTSSCKKPRFKGFRCQLPTMITTCRNTVIWKCPEQNHEDIPRDAVSHDVLTESGCTHWVSEQVAGSTEQLKAKQCGRR